MYSFHFKYFLKNLYLYNIDSRITVYININYKVMAVKKKKVAVKKAPQQMQQPMQQPGTPPQGMPGFKKGGKTKMKSKC